MKDYRTKMRNTQDIVDEVINCIKKMRKSVAKAQFDESVEVIKVAPGYHLEIAGALTNSDLDIQLYLIKGAYTCMSREIDNTKWRVSSAESVLECIDALNSGKYEKLLIPQ